jgi:hypothetical protein
MCVPYFLLLGLLKITDPGADHIEQLLLLASIPCKQRTRIGYLLAGWACADTSRRCPLLPESVDEG